MSKTVRWGCLGATLLLAATVTACGTVDRDGQAPRTERGPVSLAGQQVETDGSTALSVGVPSCNGDPTLDALTERSDTVELEVVTTQVVSGDGDACLDVLTVELTEPLGTREVVDAVSGTSLTVVELPPADTLQECFDADYPLEPTFGDPREALSDVLATDAGLMGVPDHVDAYELVERTPDRIDARTRLDADAEVTWELVRDTDGRWGVVALGGCLTTGS